MTLHQAVRMLPCLRGLVDAGLPPASFTTQADYIRMIGCLSREQACDIDARLREITKLAPNDNEFYDSCSELSGVLDAMHDTNRIQPDNGPMIPNGE